MIDVACRTEPSSLEFKVPTHKRPIPEGSNGVKNGSSGARGQAEEAAVPGTLFSMGTSHPEATSRHIMAAGGLLSLEWEFGRSYWTFDGDGDIQTFDVCKIVGKGFGVVARRHLATGTRLMAEVPLARLKSVTWASRAAAEVELDAVLAKLSQPAREDFFRLSQSGKHGSTQNAMGTWLTNALPINYDDPSSPNADEAAVFATISRLNHSCSPSCHQEWNAALGMETVHVLRPVVPGEELTICYLSPAGRPRAERMAILQEKFGFECDCAVCLLSGESRRRSDAAQQALGRGLLSGDDDQELLGGGGASSTSAAAVDEKLRLLSQEGLPAVWGRPLVLAAAMQSSAGGQHELAVGWLERALKIVRDACGEDSPGFTAVEQLKSAVEEMAQLHAQLGAFRRC